MPSRRLKSSTVFKFGSLVVVLLVGIAVLQTAPRARKEFHRDSFDAEKRLRDVLEGCGEVCDTSIRGVPSKDFDRITKKFDCTALLANEAVDAARSGPAVHIPKLMVPHFSYDGRVKLETFVAGILDDKTLGTPVPLLWTEELIDSTARNCSAGRLKGTYSPVEVAALRAGLEKMESLKGGHALVIGSQAPWVEACALAHGAREVTTLEYREIQSRHPRVHAMTPDVARQKYLRGELPQYDVILTFSSVEHSGLGRYGDALNPWGDLQAMARAWCLCRPGGQLLNAVPHEDTSDRIEWNAHRVYGPVMRSHLYANWEQIYLQPEKSFQPVRVLAKPPSLDFARNWTCPALQLDAPLRAFGTKCDLGLMLRMLVDQTPFAFAQFNAGAVLAMTESTGATDDGRQALSLRLQERMRGAFRARAANLFFGLPCSLVDPDTHAWCTADLVASAPGQPAVQVTPAAVWVDANFRAAKELLLLFLRVNSDRRFHLVVDATADVEAWKRRSGIVPASVLRVPREEAFPAGYEEHQGAHASFAAGDVVLLTAGPTGTMLAVEWFLKQPAATYLDLARFFDRDFYGQAQGDHDEERRERWRPCNTHEDDLWHIDVDYWRREICRGKDC